MNDQDYPEASFRGMQSEEITALNLHPLTYKLLESLWEDDYESFGLISPSEDNESFEMIKKVDINIKMIPEETTVKLCVLTDKELFDGADADQDSPANLIWREVDPYITAAIREIASQLFMLWNEEG
jgi:hypothetical protein